MLAEGQVYVFARSFEREQVLVAINAGDAAAQVEVQAQGAYASIFGKAKVGSVEKGLRLKLDPHGSVVLKQFG
jgi:hypothetical protein